MMHEHKLINIITLILILFFLGISVYFVQQTLFSRQEADERNLLTFTASTPGVLKDRELSIEVRIKKPDVPVTGVYFSLTYPERKMTLVSIDDWSSPFDIPGESLARSGFLVYGRDSSKPLIGDQKVAVLKFKALEPVNINELSVTGDASIVSPDLKNVISQRPTVTYVEKQKTQSQSFFDFINTIITDFPRLLIK